MFSRLLILFITIPIIDLAILIWLSSVFNWQTTILIIIASGIIGAWLAANQSRKVKTRIQAELNQQKLPSGSLISDGAIIFFAAGLLLTPGLLTDTFGLSLLIPPIRNWYKSLAKKWFADKVHFQSMVFTQTQFPGSSRPDEDVLEGHVVNRDPNSSSIKTVDGGAIEDYTEQ